MSRPLGMLLLLSGMLVLMSLGCADKKEERLWQRAQSSDSLRVYREFLSLYPKSQRARLAQSKVDDLMHPLKAKGFPDLELVTSDLGLSCWDDSTVITAYKVTKPTFISWGDLEKYFNWQADGARMWHPRGAAESLAGMSINDAGEMVTFGSMCIGTSGRTILISGSTVKKSGGILFEKDAIIAHQ